MAVDFRLSSDFLATFWRLSDYDQRLSRSEASDFGWRLSDYDRPPNFRVEVRRFSYPLPALPLPGALVPWCPGALDPLPGMCGKVQLSIHYNLSIKNLKIYQ